MIYLIISECGKLMQREYKTRHDWVDKVIYKKLYKKLKFLPYYQMVYAKASIGPGE